MKTDLTFDTLDACLVAEREMRKQWTEEFNAILKRSPVPSKDSVEFVQKQMTWGTCIPTK